MKKALWFLLVSVSLCSAGACGGGSGVDGAKSLTALTGEEYTKVCSYYNTRADEISMQTCGSNMVKPNVKHIPCGTMTNLVKGSGTCAARVADIDSCINGSNACTATGAATAPSTCPLLGNCFASAPPGPN